MRLGVEVNCGHGLVCLSGSELHGSGLICFSPATQEGEKMLFSLDDDPVCPFH
jgi:hypothetical protein